jgi:hypothetical protein
MEYSVDHEEEESDEPEIVTYEQKPTTIDGVELEPLPMQVDEKTFSFSEYQEDREGSSEVQVSKSEDTTEEGTGSFDELGPEAAGFIDEAEELEEASGNVTEVETGDEEDAFVFEDLVEEIVSEPEVEISPAPPVEPMDQASVQQPMDAQIPEGAPPPSEEQGDQVPIESPPSPAEPVPASTDAPHEGVLSEEHVEPPTDPTATGGAISTETLADLYAKQGLTEKAVEIYQQILLEKPDDQAVLLKLRALEESAQKKLQEEPPQAAADSEPEVVSADPDDPVTTLENWLRNAERMKRT